VVAMARQVARSPARVGEMRFDNTAINTLPVGSGADSDQMRVQRTQVRETVGADSAYMDRVAERARVRFERFFRERGANVVLELLTSRVQLHGGRITATYRMAVSTPHALADALGVVPPTDVHTGRPAVPSGDALCASVDARLARELPGYDLAYTHAFEWNRALGAEEWRPTWRINYHEAHDPTRWPLLRQWVWHASRRLGIPRRHAWVVMICATFITLSLCYLVVSTWVYADPCRYLLQRIMHLVGVRGL